MNDWNDRPQTEPTPDPVPGPTQQTQASGFCQHCGRPLTSETIRRVGSAVYCEPCLAARIHAGAPASAPGYGSVRAGAFYPNGAWATENLNAAGPNPGLAALLGLIPGVGAMYNEQYAKGIVHLVVFAVLVSLSDNVSGIFGLFVAGWIFYMAIEAHHTARARRDGTPLPNPFGLNDIGERLGFGKAWPAGPTVAEVANDAAAAAAASFNQVTTPPGTTGQAPPAAAPAGSAGAWGAPVDAYAQTSYAPPAYSPASAAQPYSSSPPFVDAAYAQGYPGVGYGPAMPPVPPVQPFSGAYTAVPPVDPAAYMPQPSRFPAGAVWLIALGTIFLLTTTGIFNGVPAEALIGCVLLGLAAWLFLRRMMNSGASLANDHTAAYPLRLLHALQAGVWLGLLGVLFLLDAFNVLHWRHSWPLFIILGGVMALLNRAAYQAAASAVYMPAAAPTPEPSDPSKGAI